MIHPSIRGRILFSASNAQSLLCAFRAGIQQSSRNSVVIQKAGYQIPARSSKGRIKLSPAPSSKIPKGSNAIDLLQNRLKKELDNDGWRQKLFERSSPNALRPGDVVRVHFKPNQDSTTIMGTIMGIRRAGLDTSVRIRTEVARLGVEMSIKVYSTSVRTFEFVSRAAKRARRAKLYYLRPDERK
ncbi:translation protein SH3-like domain-containing protein [Dipodascopsis uninucleata]